MNKKGGVVTDMIGGTANLIILVVLALIIVSTIMGASLLGTAPRTNTSVLNENQATTRIVFVNNTNYTVNAFSDVYATNSFTIMGAYNQTGANQGYNFSIGTANFSISNAGIIFNTSTYTWSNISINYTYIRVGTTPTENATSGNLSANFSSGINNVAVKIPTILLLSIIVVLFGVLVLLVVQARRTGMFGGMTSS